ncbi:MAG: hypothetical protein PSV46_23630 [Reyranella sp.]|nr:hypothetical protein [Reyranella sp.]
MQPRFEPKLQLDTTFGHCDELRIEFRGADLTANVQYFRAAGTFTRTIAFNFVEAHSLYTEPMLPLSAKHCVDRLCEIFGSEWLDRFEKRMRQYRGTFHHYAIYFT